MPNLYIIFKYLFMFENVINILFNIIILYDILNGVYIESQNQSKYKKWETVQKVNIY